MMVLRFKSRARKQGVVRGQFYRSVNLEAVLWQVGVKADMFDQRGLEKGCREADDQRLCASWGAGRLEVASCGRKKQALEAILELEKSVRKGKYSYPKG